ncbi:MAG: hypothetical protein J2P28_06575 [Actinobacteria bacterium]|nr:hypothetical protein [Actinomycetota bacterium]
MSNKRKIASAVFTGVAAGGIGVFAAAPALAAASTWHISRGGPYTGLNTTG